MALLIFLPLAYYISNITRNNACDIGVHLETARSATVPKATDQGTGSGFYISGNGHVVTAQHVIDGANEIYLNYVSGKIPLKVVAQFKDRDLALLKQDIKIMDG